MRNRFRAVEMGIFAVVSLIFLNSVYNLFTDGKLAGDNERRPIALKDKASDVGAEAREPASADGVTGFVPYQTRCQTSGESLTTKASKVRIIGPFCGAPAARQVASSTPAPAVLPTQYHIENTTNHFVATVFTEPADGKFLTDFIPLDSGPNTIEMEFRYRSKVYPVELKVIRN